MQPATKVLRSLCPGLLPDLRRKGPRVRDPPPTPRQGVMRTPFHLAVSTARFTHVLVLIQNVNCENLLKGPLTERCAKWPLNTNGKALSQCAVIERLYSSPAVRNDAPA